MSFLILGNVSKTYPGPEGAVRALKKSDLSITRGEFVSIMGPSGSGKSTLLSVIGAMNKPSTGMLLVDEIDVYSLNNEKRADFRREYLGFVFQQLQLIPYLTAIENTMLPLAVKRTNSKKTRALEALARVGLEDKARRLPNQLSGGEQARVAIARAIVNSADIILADEPTGNLDSESSNKVMDMFKDLSDTGHTVILVTHDRENAMYSQRVIHMVDGAIDNTDYDISI